MDRRSFSLGLAAVCSTSLVASCDTVRSAGGFKPMPPQPGHFFANTLRPASADFVYQAPGPGECKHKKIATIRGPITLKSRDKSQRLIRTYRNITIIMTSSSVEEVCQDQKEPRSTLSGGFYSKGGKVIVADGGNGQPKAVRIDIYDLGGNIALTLFDASYPSVHTCYGEKNVVFRERNISNHLFSTAKGIKFTAYGGHFVWC